MSRKIYNRLSFMAVSWLDESTLKVDSGGRMDFETWIAGHTRYLKVHGYAARAFDFARCWQGARPR